MHLAAVGQQPLVSDSPHPYAGPDQKNDVATFAANLVRRPSSGFTVFQPMTTIHAEPPFELRYTAACLVGTRKAWLYTITNEATRKQWHIYLFSTDDASGEQIRATLAKFGQFNEDQGYTRTVELVDIE